MKKIANALELIKSLGGDPTTGICSCPVSGHGKGRGDKRPSLWISPQGAGLKCKAPGCTYKDVVAAIKAGGTVVRYEKQPSKATRLPPVAVELDEARRFLDLIDPDAEAWTFQTFSDDGTHPKQARILHGSLAEHASELKRLSRYGAGAFVCLQRTDGKGRKAENIVGIRAVSLDLDGAVLDPVQQCELPPHVIVESSPGRYWAHWAVKDLPLAEFEAIVRGIAKRFGGDASIAELAHCCRLPGFEHCKIPTERFPVRIVEANERPAYTADEIRKAFPPVKKAAAPKIESPTLKAQRERSASLADKYIARDGSSPKLDAVEQATAEAAKLDKIAYELERKALAESLGIRTTVLDEIVAERREDEKVVSRFVLDEPWPEAVDGGELLGELRDTFARHVVMQPSACLACALWTLLTYVHDAFWISPILYINSPTMRCGKTTLLEVLHGVVTKALPSSNITVAAVFRVVDKYHPTLLIDEADTFLNNDELRGIINSGHNRATSFVTRCVGDDQTPTDFSTWAPKAIARIGKMSATLVDRSIGIGLKRKLKGEKAERPPKDTKAAFTIIRRKCIRWASDHFAALQDANPAIPVDLHDRAQDNWETLLAIAEACGKEWAAKARAVALRLESKAASVDNENLGIVLLGDIKEMFDKTDAVGELESGEIVEHLVGREDRPWSEYYKGKPITARGVARLLEPFYIRPKRLTGSSRAQGYRRKQFAFAWKRYLPPEVPK